MTANMRRSENEREEKRDDIIIHMTIVEAYNSGTDDMKQKMMSSMKSNDNIRSDQIRMRDMVRGGQVII